MPSQEEIEAFREDIEVIEDNTVTIDGVEYSCIATEFGRGDTLEQGGFVRNYTLSIHCRKVLFTAQTMPKERQSVFQYDGRTLACIRIIDDPDTVMVEFQLNSETENQ